MEEKQSGIVIQKKHIAIAAIVILLLLAAGVLAGMYFGKSGESPSSANAAVQNAQQEDKAQSEKAPIELDENAGEYTGELPQQKGETPKGAGIKIPGYPSITIAKDTQDVMMALLNPEGNPCYFKFVIVLKDTNETIFESKYVKPGDCIYDVHLTRPLAEGEYESVIQISTLSLDGETPLNGANVETLLIAE